MSARAISEKLRNFIFEHLDSVECLEILLLLHSDFSKSWSADELASELRSNPNSAKERAQILRKSGILLPETDPRFQYRSDLHEFNEIVDELVYHCRIQRHKVYELIFSPLKKARDFADCFVKPGTREDSDNG